ncbi:DS-domain-containing protein [Lindgomyces ingoldianus]|uniref:DS-domain-containing protein n=1 Tax=Lindgomyces ingoldianus TaxID=673940 RepID=A0ACB6R5N8_9PLEO|nr:DS-domain-containing protein [Lindgomyces ingoldianus]KAF2474158.1 DS-domain-containing protein [Lindgomyces ingoldianus]
MAPANHDRTSKAPSGATDAVLKPSEAVPVGSREVQGIDFDHYAQRNITVEELVAGMVNMGFQATSVGEAVRIINGMGAWEHPETAEGTTIFLGYTSNLISSGLRETFRYLVQHKHVSAIVTTAGGVEEDFIKCLAPTYLGSFSSPGAALRAKGMNRIGNLFVPNSNYCAFEDWVVPILDQMLEEQEVSKKTDEPIHWTPSKVINRLGKEINDERSVYYWAWKNSIPVFCPALTDGSLGDMLYFHTFKSSPEQLRIDIVEDIRKINTMAVRAKRAGMIILGGGVVKHHIANACLMRNGAESAVYINTAQEFDGSDAGARPDEAVSWGKIKADGDSVKVYAEATIVFPLIVAATFAKIKQAEKEALSLFDEPKCAMMQVYDSSAAMSVNVEQPPAPLFGQPSSPSFSSPPQSPNHLHHTQTPVSSPPPQASDDVDMSASTTLLPPVGQNHDREDALMQDSGGLTNGHLETNTNSLESPPNAVAVEVAAVDEDAMDITPDSSQGLVLPNGSADPQQAHGNAPSTPAPNGVLPGGSENNEQQPSAANANESNTEIAPPVEPPPPADPSIQPPPPPVEPVQSVSDSSDDDDGAQAWQPIQEDTSTPDETEMKEIEATPEFSALDHDHWEKKAFLPLDEPEFTAGMSGRIEWSIEQYNGTKEKPNKDLVMKSQPVNIGGYDWQIKFYPKGNDSDYLSVYVECLSVADKGAKKDRNLTSEDSANQDDEMVTGDDAAPISTPEPQEVEPQHTPLPLLDPTPIPKRRSVAAQVSVVLYNPSEPRVNYSRTCLHRFCTGSPDWGWTRFHGPYYDISHRIRGQRQALLRDDKLAFTGYIRVINDDTNCLWEHHSRDNPWDSFAMTGLQSLTLGEGASSPGGNMISAIASWMLFKPVRLFLYHLKVPDPEKEPFTGTSSVALDDVLDALEWYGIHERLDKLDVIELWEVLRLKLEDELRDTPYTSVMDDMFGLKKNYTTGIPNYRVPVVGVNTMQEAINKAADFAHPGHPLPQLLTVELKRQDFDTPTRSYVKLLNKVSLDDYIDVRGIQYTLYGFVVHKQTLQSYLYHPVLRPGGPGSKWYTYTDGKEENMVKCLTKRQAIDLHEGNPGSDKVIGNDAVAYIAMYVRNDVSSNAFKAEAESELWEVPEWLRAEVEKSQSSNVSPIPIPVPPPLGDDLKPSTEEESKAKEEPELPKVHDFQVIDSRVFLQHEGPGTFDAYDPEWQPDKSDFIYTVQLTATDGCDDVREKLAKVIKDIKNPRQIKFWFVDTMRGTFRRPYLLGTGKIEYSSGSTDHYADDSKPWALQDFQDSWMAVRIWVHIIDVADLRELPKEDPKPPESAPISQAVPPTSLEPPQPTLSMTEVPAPELPEVVPQAEDTPMSEPDEPAAPPLGPQPQDPQSPAHPETAEVADTAMVEVEVEVPVESTPIADPPAVDVVIPNPAAPTDTEMGGTQDIILPPPPPPPIADLPPEPTAPTMDFQQQTAVPPPPEPVNVIPEEIYFFLKFFDAEAQTLESRGSHIALKAARVDSTVLSLLGLPSDKKIELFEEEDLTTTHPIRTRRSFTQNDLHNTTVIIATLPLSEEQRNALVARAAFADPQPYLAFRAQARNFPSRLTGHFTHNYFSSQFYKGEMKNGHRHGQGTRIYHTGATYEGTFLLSRRHGHGLYTFQNGDTYEGEWVQDQQHGTGTFVEAATGNTYVGGWKNDKKFGEGVTHWKNAQETERLCRICWEEGADSAFYDCGHVVACLQCAKRVDSCPVCRKRVVSAMKLYYVA